MNLDDIVNAISAIAGVGSLALQIIEGRRRQSDARDNAGDGRPASDADPGCCEPGSTPTE
ncbi:hypothetical protein HUT19_33125 [Streptomyces sp. NA02950]|uniref:hypothetical protein n=1 Tax=Streptomyces sp. NA02950 TaxID=2742137 RepID=UPI0015906F67|nr:hypothetical protein [Streptomyces sp. NA02950]QKV95981.1 hypothetical protein HUT19_33125 [Streptomyces sp. NA02950]